MAQRKEREPSPTEQIGALARALAEPRLPRIVILRGDERWFREDALRHVLEAARRAEMEIEKHDAVDPDFDVRSLADALCAPPMFATSRCVVVRHANALLKKDGGSDSTITRAVLGWLGDSGASGMIVLDAEGLRADHAVSKAALAARGQVLNLRRLWDGPPPWDPDPRKSELVQWTVARARERKVSLTLDDALYVAAATGNDLFGIDAALERIGRRAGGSVRGLVAWTSGGSPFELAEHVCRGDLKQSIAGIEALFRLGFSDKGGEREIDRGALLVITFGALRGKLRASAAAARVLSQGGKIEDAATAAGVNNFAKAREEFALRMRARPHADWVRMLFDFAALERRTRRGGITDANDLAEFALRWRRQPATTSAARRG